MFVCLKVPCLRLFLSFSYRRIQGKAYWSWIASNHSLLLYVGITFPCFSLLSLAGAHILIHVLQYIYIAIGFNWKLNSQCFYFSATLFKVKPTNLSFWVGNDYPIPTHHCPINILHLIPFLLLTILRD